MGVCCIVFDIDGMFEFFINFLNIEKNKFQNFMFSSHFMIFPTFKKKIGVKIFFGGVGGNTSLLLSPAARKPGTGDIATPPY